MPDCLVTSTYASPLGELLLAASDRGLAGVWFSGQKHWPAEAAAWPRQAAHPVLCEAARQLDAWFAGQRSGFDLPLDLRAGTSFQQSVWRALLAIPRGQTRGYGELAAALGLARGAARAVGAAVGRNPLSIVVPCHRVVGRGGALTGYAGGLARKAALLGLEGTTSARA